VVRIPIYELPSLRCGFYEVFSDNTKIIFNGYAMIDVQKFNFACSLGEIFLNPWYQMFHNCWLKPKLLS